MEAFLLVMGFVYSLYNDYRVLLDNMSTGFRGVSAPFVRAVSADAVACERGSPPRAYLSTFPRRARECGEVTVLTHAKRGMDRLEPL
ncbi:hypothetical protein FA385_24035 [Pseudomonas aeruginosa]|nr:hypothetical protein [Pseudomonas aeruginosa]